MSLLGVLGVTCALERVREREVRLRVFDFEPGARARTLVAVHSLSGVCGGAQPPSTGVNDLRPVSGTRQRALGMGWVDDSKMETSAMPKG